MTPHAFRPALASLACLAAACFLTGVLAAQSSNGVLSGKVSAKADGHPVRALVTYRNASNNNTNYILSNALGFYSFPALPPGVYTVRADTPTQPFVSQEKDGIEITVGGQMVVDFSLEPKGGTAAVSVGVNTSPYLPTVF